MGKNYRERKKGNRENKKASKAEHREFNRGTN